MKLTVIDLEAVLNVKKIKKTGLFSKLNKSSLIMLAGASIDKNEVDNLKVSYDYFFRKDKNLVLKKHEVLADTSSLMDAVEIAKVDQKVSDDDIFIFGRNLEFLEDNSYQVFDLDDRFTDIYEPTSEIDTFIKKIVNR